MKPDTVSLSAWQRSLIAMIEHEDASGLSGLSSQCALLPISGCGVYRDSSRQARLAVLRQDHPVLRELLGADCFDRIAMDHVDAVASRDSDLNRYGTDFADWVEHNVLARDGFEDLPWLADLTRLERTLYDSSFITAHPEPTNPAAVPASDPALHLATHISLFRSPWPVHRVWWAHQPGQQVKAISMDRDDHRLVIEHAANEHVFHEVDEEAWCLLDAVRTDTTLRELVIDRSLNVQRLSELVMKRWLIVEPPA